MKKLSLFFFLIFSLTSYSYAEDEKKENPTQNIPAKNQFFPSFADIVEPLTKSVVNIYTVQYRKNKNGAATRFPEGFPFDNFNEFFEHFNNMFDFEEIYDNPRAMSLGSGFVIDPEGYIVTNRHVIEGADEINVKLTDNLELPAKLIGSDQKTDLALLKVESKEKLPSLKFGDSSKSRVGDWVIAIGNPFGLGGSVTTGIISSKGRDIDIKGVDDCIQTDAAINGGNSGGPLFNVSGEVIGVNTAILSPSGTNIGIGFAIPSNIVGDVVEKLKKNGKISRGKLDVAVQDVTPDLAEGLNIDAKEGVIVSEVLPGGAGEAAGLKTGDVIISFNGTSVKNSRKLQIAVSDAPLDREVKLEIIRDGAKMELTSKIREEEQNISKEKSKSGKNSSAKSMEKNKIVFSDLTQSLRVKFRVKENIKGILVTKISEKDYGLKMGDLVISVNKKPVENLDDFTKIYEESAKEKKKHIVLSVKRGSHSSNIFVAFPVEG